MSTLFFIGCGIFGGFILLFVGFKLFIEAVNHHHDTHGTGEL
jgi:predicted tellurium resistance membrane protein TerC